MQIIRTGYCPFKAKKASINIDYIDSSDLNRRSFTKGRFFVIQKNASQTIALFGKSLLA